MTFTFLSCACLMPSCAHIFPLCTSSAILHEMLEIENRYELSLQNLSLTAVTF